LDTPSRPAPDHWLAARRWLRAGLGAAAMLSLLVSPISVAHAQDQAGPSIIRDTEIEEILHHEMDPVFAAANLDPKSVRLYVVDDSAQPEPNAETGAGYDMIVTSSLVMETKTPNELMGVLAHETGHMARGDVARSGQEGRAGMGPMIAGLGLGILAAIAGRPDAAAALIYSGSFFGQLNMLAYDREQEARADEAAVTYMEKAGYSSQGLVDFFNTFRYQEVFSDIKKFKYFVDHPLTDDRIEALATRARNQPHYGVKDTPEAIAEYELMKAKLKGFLNRPYQTFVDFSETDTSFPARYARAIAYYKELETDKAIKTIDALIVERPDDPYLYELKGQALMESARTTEAEAPLRKAVSLKPEAPLLRILFAQDLLAEDNRAKLDEAVVNLNRSLVVEGDNPIAWQFLSEAYDAKQMPGMARLATAEQNFNLGQLKDARVFAIRARQLLQKDTPEWRRATDIVLASKPSPDELKELGRQS
jgi:predicted Zn-dependent protease